MSENWTVFCQTHEVFGPDMRRTAGRRLHLSRMWPRRHPKLSAERLMEGEPEVLWDEFMAEHGWCDLRLLHE